MLPANHWRETVEPIPSIRDYLPLSRQIAEEGRYRRALDEVVFDVLGLTASEREAVYEAVVELGRAQLEKAKTV